MSANAKKTRANVIPTMRYRDAPAAIEWLCRAFGFEKHLVVSGEDGIIAHAQLAFGNGMIMLGSATDSEFGRLIKPPADVGGLGVERCILLRWIPLAGEKCKRHGPVLSYLRTN